MKNQIIDPSGAFFKWKDLPYSWYAFWKTENKYEVTRSYSMQLSFRPYYNIESKFYSISDTGILKIEKGYRWDGASGPTFDTKATMRAGCIHDVLYQAMRENKLDIYKYKGMADSELGSIMKEDSESPEIWSNIRSSYYEWAVNIAGWKAAGGSNMDALKGIVGLI